MKSKPAVLIFYRSGWCPYGSHHLMALASVEKDFSAAGYQVPAISASFFAPLKKRAGLLIQNYTRATHPRRHFST